MTQQGWVSDLTLLSFVPSEMSVAFQLENLTCQYGELTALDRVSLSIGEGEQVALIGPSGSGKTTLLRCLNMMRQEDGGSLSIFGNNPGTLSAKALRKLRAEIATIPQHLGLVPNLTSIQNIVLGRGGKRGAWRSLRDLLFPSRADSLVIHEILERVGVEEKLFSRVSQLSGGQQQWIAFARSIFQNPRALLADEPVSSVDPARARDTVALFGELSREHGFTLVVSLHDVELARTFFPRLIGLRAGKVVFDGSPESLSETALKELYQLSDEEMLQDA